MPQTTLNTNSVFAQSPNATEVVSFGGFHSLQANFLYCPNQFFDVLLPHCSRGCVRLVGYMLRQTLGYLDADGNPLRSKIEFTYNDLIEGANIARGAIRDALDEALAGHFIRCVRQGRAHSAGRRGNSALYSLRWDGQGGYLTDPTLFHGFYEGDGNRTTIPNDYFDVVVRRETLSVARVVGTVLRHTIGWQNPKGGRRQQAKMSFESIKANTGIQHNSTVSEALEEAISSNYITRVAEGYFDRRGGGQNVASVYSVRWFGSINCETDSSKNRPETILRERFKKPTDGLSVPTVQKTDREAFKKPTEEAFKKPTSINNKGKEILKQQQPDDQGILPLFVKANAGDTVAAVEDFGVFEILIQEGFDEKTSRHLASTATPETIQQQVAWMARRKATKNRLGMLRLAILENWKEPVSIESAATDEDSPAHVFARHAYAGYNNHTGTPTAKPSTLDIEAAQVLAQELLTVWPDPARVAEFGRHFGRFWREREERTRTRSQSLPSALRLHGDAFLPEIERRRSGHLRKMHQQARETHEGRFKPLWLAYLKEEERKARCEQAEAYAQFQQERAGRLMQSLNSPFLNGPSGSFRALREAITRNHESEESRLADFLSFFQEKVCDFWTWDKQFNQTPFLT